MFGELPKLLDKDFAIGYFLPVVLDLSSNVFLFSSLGFADKFKGTAVLDTLLGTTLIVLVSWAIGVFLLATNREMIRILEGYGSLNPVRAFRYVEKKIFLRLNKENQRLSEEYYQLKDTGAEIPRSLVKKRNKVLLKLAQEFPSEEELILPTPFGNVLRAFETYPLIMYGIEGTEGWNRLLPLLPDNHLKQVNTAKAIVDYWINMGLFSLLFFVEVCTLRGIFPSNLFLLFLAAIAIVLTWICCYRATSSAVDWGVYIKASFDLFLPDLAKKIGLDLPADRAEEKELWKAFSQSTIYRVPEILPARKPKMD